MSVWRGKIYLLVNIASLFLETKITLIIFTQC